MADLSPERKNIQTEETQVQFAVSESVFQKVGRSINFINDRQYSVKRFPINGPYSIATYPVLGVDGLVVFEYDVEIVNVWMYSIVAGSSGTTELDLKRATSPGGSFTSIFSTTPKITSSASSGVWVGEGDSVTGCTAPILSTVNLDAGDALRCDIISAMSGGQNCGLNVHYRPR